MPLSFRQLLLVVVALCGLASCATAMATPHPLRTARSAALGVQPADSSLQRQARQLLIRGMTHARLGDHERALEFYLQAVEIASDQPAALSAVASTYDALDHLPSALLYAERAVRIAPKNAAYWLHWTDLLKRDDQRAALEESVTDMLDRFPREPEVVRAAIEHRLERDRVEEVVPLATRLAEGHPAEVPWEALLPHLSVERHADLLERGLRYQMNARPDDAEPYASLGRMYLQSNRPAEALEVLEAGQLYSREAGSLSGLVAQARRATGATTSDAAPAEQVAEAKRLLAEAPSPADRERANRLLNKALSAEPDLTDALALSGRLAYEAGDYPTAIERLQRALKLNPRDVALWELAAEAQLATNDAGGALKTLNEALLLFPGQPPLLLARARTHLALDQPDRAEADAQRAADVTPTAPGERRPSRRQPEESPPTAEDQNPGRRGDESSTAEPHQTDALADAGRVAFEAGNFSAAAEQLQRALKTNPRDVAVWELTAEAQLAAENAEEALHTLDRALRVFPRHPSLLLQRAKAHLALGHVSVAAGYARLALREGEGAPPADRAAAYMVYGDARLAQGQTEQAREAWERALQLTPDDEALRRRLQQL